MSQLGQSSKWLSSLSDFRDAPDDAVIRLVAGDDGIVLAIGTAQPSDATFAHAEKTVLAIDEQISKLLANKKLDVKVTGDQPKLKLMEQRQE